MYTQLKSFLESRDLTDKFVNAFARTPNFKEHRKAHLRDVTNFLENEGVGLGGAIISSFIWSDTEEGLSFWSQVQKEWKLEADKDLEPEDSPQEEDTISGKPNYYIGCIKGIEASDVIADFQGDSYNLGTAITYLLRAGKKPYVDNCPTKSKIKDIEKAIDHLNFELKRLNHDGNN